MKIKFNPIRPGTPIIPLRIDLHLKIHEQIICHKLFLYQWTQLSKYTISKYTIYIQYYKKTKKHLIVISIRETVQFMCEMKIKENTQRIYIVKKIHLIIKDYNVIIHYNA